MIGLLELFVLYISTVNICSLGFLAVGKFNVATVLVVSLLITIILFKFFKFHLYFKDLRFNFVVLVILLLSVLFRFNPYLYVMGGQDEGTYVNISKQYEKGRLYYLDEFRASLNKEQKRMYDAHNSMLMPSIIPRNFENNTFAMSFYPLHPAWMTVFGEIFGSDNRVYSLTMFSLLSIIGFYLLGYELSSRKKLAGYLAALFMVVNPLHVFFSNFPVGEIVALAFTSLSFYYLAKYYNDAKEGSVNIFSLVLSALLMNGFFYTRMSSFMYLPIFYLIALLTVLYVKEKNIKKHLLMYLFSVLILWVGSYVYYFKFLMEVFYEIYGSYFVRFLGDNTRLKIGLVIVVFIGLLWIIDKFKEKVTFQKVIKGFYKALPFILGGFILLLFIKFGLDLRSLGFSSAVPTGRWLMEGLGWLSIKHIHLFVLVQYLSPVGFILFFVAIILNSLKPQKNKFLMILGAFCLLFTFLNILFLINPRYHYYNIRYYFSEIIPFSLLLISIFLVNLYESKKFKYVSVICAALMFAYFSFFSFILFYGKEMPDINFYKSIEKRVSKDELLLVYKSFDYKDKKLSLLYNFNSYALAPLKYYFNYQLFILDTPDDVNSEPVKALMSRYNRVHIISDVDLKNYMFVKDPTPLRLHYNYFNVAPGCTLHTYEILPLEFVKGFTQKNDFMCLLPPTAYYSRYRDFYLYEVIK